MGWIKNVVTGQMRWVDPDAQPKRPAESEAEHEARILADAKRRTDVAVGLSHDEMMLRQARGRDGVRIVEPERRLDGRDARGHVRRGAAAH